MSAFSLDGRLSLDARQFVRGTQQAKQSVGDVGDAFGRLEPEARRGASNAADAVESELGKLPGSTGKIGELAGGGLGTKLIAGFGALGVGAILAGAINESFDTQRAIKKVNAAFRRTPTEAAKQGKIAGDLYAGNWGDSLGELEQRVAVTNQRIGDLTTDELERVTEGASAIAETWDEDFEAVVRSVGQLLENDLAPTAEAALDIVTAGFQDGANEAGDWLDTIDEYSQHFEAVGLSGEDMANMIVHGLQNGQRDADKLADAVKELRIRAVEDTDAISDAYDDLGLSADDTRAAFLEGGDAARDAFLDVIHALQDVEDPVERNRLAIELIGTQYEDLGPKALESLGAIESATVDVTGRNQELTDMIGDQANEWDLLKRKGEAAIAGIGLAVADALNPALDAIEELNGLIQKAGDIIDETVPGGGWVEQWINPLGYAKDAVVGIADEWDDLVGNSGDGAELVYRSQRKVVGGYGEMARANKRARDGTEKHIETQRDAHEQLDAVRDGTDDLIDVTEDSTDATDDATDAAEDHARAMEEEADRIEQARDELRKFVDDQRRHADSAIDARESQRELNKALSDATDELRDAERGSDDYQAILDDVTTAAARNADAQAQLKADTAAARGETWSATDQQDAFNDSLLDTAATAEGDARDGILEYIGTVNDIPDETMTRIQSEIDRGNLTRANELLANASRTRRATIRTDALTTGANNRIDWTSRPRLARVNVEERNAWNTSNTIDWAARDRWTTIYVNEVLRADNRATGRAGGGIVREPVTLVGEEGPELVSLPYGSLVHTATETSGILTRSSRPAATGTVTGATRPAAAMTAAAVTKTYNVTVNAGWGTDGAGVGRHVVTAITSFERSAGTGWRS